jgi:predicted metal-binding membrane protein
MLRVVAFAERGRSIPAPDGAAKAVFAAAGLAWLLAIGLAATPFDRDFGHGALEGIGHHPWVVLSLMAGWVLMVAAMMLPTAVPLVSGFARAVDPAADRRRLVVTLLAGYVVVWLAAGVAMHAGDLGVHWLVHRSAWLREHTWTIAAGTLVVAGLYQFSAAKARFLRCCRAHRRLIAGDASAFRIGMTHGAHCVGCCWGLMLVMFSVGVASVTWMFALTAVMVAEKVTPVGHRASAPAGAWLLCCAALTAAAA